MPGCCCCCCSPAQQIAQVLKVKPWAPERAEKLDAEACDAGRASAERWHGAVLILQRRLERLSSLGRSSAEPRERCGSSESCVASGGSTLPWSCWRDERAWARGRYWRTVARAARVRQVPARAGGAAAAEPGAAEQDRCRQGEAWGQHTEERRRGTLDAESAACVHAAQEARLLEQLAMAFGSAYDFTTSSSTPAVQQISHTFDVLVRFLWLAKPPSCWDCRRQAECGTPGCTWCTARIASRHPAGGAAHPAGGAPRASTRGPPAARAAGGAALHARRAAAQGAGGLGRAAGPLPGAAGAVNEWGRRA